MAYISDLARQARHIALVIQSTSPVILVQGGRPCCVGELQAAFLIRLHLARLPESKQILRSTSFAMLDHGLDSRLTSY